MLVKPKLLILPKRELYLPRDRRKLPRPAPYIFVPKFAPRLAVAFDNSAAVATTGNTATPGTSLASNTFTVAASATLAIATFACATASGTLYTASSATFQGSTMTAVGNITESDNLTNLYVFAIVSPSTGTLRSATVNFSGGSGTVDIDVGVFTFTGTDTSSVANAVPSANVITDASNSSATAYPSTAESVTTANGDAACGIMNAAAASPTGMTSGNGTLIDTEVNNMNNYAAGYHLSSGVTTTIQFAIGGAVACCGVFFRIKQPSGGDVLQSQSVM